MRLAYLFGWIVLGILLVLEFSNTSGHTHVTWGELGQSLVQILRQHWRMWLAIAIGIEMGAMSHSISDWLVSDWKRRHRPPRQSTYRRRKK